MREEVHMLIAATDRLLSEFRTLWLEAKTPADTKKWIGKINDNLDQRLKLMALRDSTN